MMSITEKIEVALEKSNGSVEYKCALQVNPYSYHVNFKSHDSDIQSEEQYNQLLVKELLENDIQVIGITDHFDIKSAKSLIEYAETNGILVFPGFEAVSKEGVHLLCLFERGTEVEALIGYIGWFELEDPDQKSPISSRTAEAILQRCVDWGGIVVAAHVCSGSGGLLEMLNGQAAIKVWKDKNLLACSISGSIDKAPQAHKGKLKNKNSDYKREQGISVINAKDMSTPEGAADPGTSTWIRMSEVSIEGLRQAFLDSESRIRLYSDEIPTKNNELVALTWEGGFLDGCGLHFANRLNVLVGGPGSGKSTVIESIRFALEKTPLVPNAIRQHKEFVDQVLGITCKVHLLVRTYSPSINEYLVTRKPGQEAQVYSFPNGEKLDLRPIDIFPDFDAFGQHELSELSRDEGKLTQLLSRFIPDTQAASGKSIQIRAELSKSTEEITQLEVKNEELKTTIALLPALIEKSKSYEKAGVAEQFSEIERLTKEEPLFTENRTTIIKVREGFEAIGSKLKFDVSKFSEEQVLTSKRKDILLEVKSIIENLESQLAETISQSIETIEEALGVLEVVRSKWLTEKETVEQTKHATITELMGKGIAVQDYFSVLEKLNTFEPKSKELDENNVSLKRLYVERDDILDMWEESLDEANRNLIRAGKKVNKNLEGSVEVIVHPNSNRESFLHYVTSNTSGRTAETVEILKGMDNLSVRDFVKSCRAGPEYLQADYGITENQARALSNQRSEFFLELEEIRLEPTVEILLNIGDLTNQKWKALRSLSTGQKATAILLLLLLESDSPLLVDQPEDDLANRFITEKIVPDLKRTKKQRQFLLATHDPNIPVLGDAELIVCMDSPQTDIESITFGAIDTEHVRRFVESVLEGGKSAFESRRRKYGF